MLTEFISDAHLVQHFAKKFNLPMPQVMHVAARKLRQNATSQTLARLLPSLLRRYLQTCQLQDSIYMKLETQNGATSERNLMCPVKYIDIKVGNMQDMYEMEKTGVYICVIYRDKYLGSLGTYVYRYIHIYICMHSICMQRI